MKYIYNGKNRITQTFILNQHNGLDIVGDTDKTIISPINGVVKSSTIVTNRNNPTWEWGHYVRVDDKNGNRLFFCHMDSRIAKVGQRVVVGDKLGIMGNTGKSFGAHCHFEVRKSDGRTVIDPAEYLEISNKVGTYENGRKDNKMLKGIDVSKHQGKIDWSKVKVDFAILRAGYGMYEHQKDPTFEYNYTECKKHNIPVGVYWYSYATTLAEVKKEAEICLKILKGKTLEYPCFFDQEYESGIKALTKTARTELCLAFMEAIKNAGYKTGLYCSYDWIKNWVDSKKLVEYDKWIAQYSNSCSYSGKDLALWQYSSKGSISGIKGSVDMNYCYKEYDNSKIEIDSTTSHPSSAFTVGQEIKLVSNAKYTSGKAVPNWVINSKLYVRQIQGNNLVISTQKSGAITGVVAKDQILKNNSSNKVKVTADRLNIRSGPNTSYSIVGLAKKGEIYEIYKEQDDWGKIDKGWVSLNYIEKI